MNQPTLKRLACLSLSLMFVVGCGSANTREPIEDTTIETPAPTTGAVENGAAAAAKPEAVAESKAGSTAAPAQEAKATRAVETAQVGLSRTDALLAAITIFMLAIFVGFELITKVPPTLHTPLMSGSNAISGITLVGALLMAGNNQSGWAAFFGMLAVAMATVNVVGGFMVTDRMLSMFRGK